MAGPSSGDTVETATTESSYIPSQAVPWQCKCVLWCTCQTTLFPAPLPLNLLSTSPVLSLLQVHLYSMYSIHAHIPFNVSDTHGLWRSFVCSSCVPFL